MLLWGGPFPIPSLARSLNIMHTTLGGRGATKTNNDSHSSGWRAKKIKKHTPPFPPSPPSPRLSPPFPPLPSPPLPFPPLSPQQCLASPPFPSPSPSVPSLSLQTCPLPANSVIIVVLCFLSASAPPRLPSPLLCQRCLKTTPSWHPLPSFPPLPPPALAPLPSVLVLVLQY